MRSKFQYAYSIFVFIGVLSTAYFMMNRSDNARGTLGGIQPSPLRNEAAVSDPAVESLMEIERALTKHRRDKIEKRVPTESVKAD